MKPELIFKFIRFRRSQDGSVAIAFVAFMLVVFSTLGYVSYSVMTSDTQLSIRTMQTSQARYLAEAGVEYAIKTLMSGDSLSSSETVNIEDGTFTILKNQLEDGLEITSTGNMGNASKSLQISTNYRPPISSFAIYSTDEIDDVDALDEAGDPDPTLMVEHAVSLPTIDNQALIDTATAQGHIQTASTFEPSSGYPNYNFYYNGTEPNVTYVTGNLKVNGGRTIYGIFVVMGNITLNGSSRVEGVLYMLTPHEVVIHGGGNPSESSVTGGIVAAGEVDGHGNHITVHYKAEYMSLFGAYEDRTSSIMSMRWREL